MRIEKYSFGTGDRFGREGRAQLSAIQEINLSGTQVVPVWNKSNREHTIIGSEPADVKAAAASAVSSVAYAGSYYVDADHISIGNVDRFADSSEDNVNTNFACAACVFLLTHYYGFKAHGAAYLKHFVGPTPWLAPLMIPIEIIGHLARPLSLTLRLFGNMFGDHMNLMVFLGMMIGLSKAFIWAAPIAALVPIVIICLGIFVAVVQTYVFILLTMSYISGAIAEAH